MSNFGFFGFFGFHRHILTISKSMLWFFWVSPTLFNVCVMDIVLVKVGTCGYPFVNVQYMFVAEAVGARCVS